MQPVLETPDLFVPMPDGTRLAARLWRPDTARPVPAVLEFLPYRRRDGTAVRDALTWPWFAAHGVAGLRVDQRGHGDSDGLAEDEYAAQEMADAEALIAWLAAQPWCNGRVGMMGISWGGFNALQVAARRPPALGAIVTLCSTTDRYENDIHFKGGCLLGENLGWGGTMWGYASRAPDPALRPDWREVWHARLHADPLLPATWLAHPDRDAYWRHGSVGEDFSAITAATLAVGGWGDSYRNAVFELVAGLDAPARGIVGPWVHKYPHFAVPEPRIGFLQEALAWWRRWLDDGPDDGAPVLRSYLMDALRPARWTDARPGAWVADDTWPAASVAEATLALGTDLAGPLPTVVASPQDCGLDQGEFCAIWLGPEMPGDQRRDDALSACWDSPPRPACDVLGQSRLRLRLTADRPLAQIAVRLCHVHPDGASTRLSWGCLHLGRTDHARLAPLTPGAEVEVEVALDAIGLRLPEGHRLRVAVSTALWPMLWPLPEAATVTVLGGSLHLPQRAPSPEVAMPPPVSAPPLALRQIRAPAHARRVIHDHATGRVTLALEDDFGLHENPDHGLISGGRASEAWTIHPDDPLSARAETDWTEEMTRGDIRLRTRARIAMTGDAGAFHLTARLEAWEGEALVHDRRVTEAIPRAGH